MSDLAKPAIQIIELWPHEAVCYICDAGCLYGFGIPIYEGDVVPDDYEGEWGGVPVCERCYYLVRGVQSEQPNRLVAMSDIRRLAR